MAFSFFLCAKAQYQASNWTLFAHCLKLQIKPNGFNIDSLPDCSFGFLANSNISDSQGNLLFFSYGLDVRDRYGNLMENGCCLCESFDLPDDCTPLDGNPHVQGALILPRPGSLDKYYLFIKDMDTAFNGQPLRVTASSIDLGLNNGLGKVTERATPILRQILSDSRMTACQHANGRDWWLVNHEYKTAKIYVHLITSDSIYGPFEQTIGHAGLEPDKDGWSIFSPNDSVFATVTGGMQGITLLDFDRCAGTFSNFRSIDYLVGESYFNLAFSPNSRFLYAGNSNYLKQYDLWAANIQQSGVEVVHDTANAPLLGMMVKMPDKRIYVANWDFDNEYLSVIDSPDLKCPSCSFHLRSIDVPGSVLISNVPNFPNYNVGPLLGSTCDTLAAVENLYDVSDEGVKIFPNPATNQVNVSFFNSDPLNTQICIYDVAGNKLYEKDFMNSNGEVTLGIETTAYANGIYCVQMNNGKTTEMDKFVIQH